MKEKRNRLPAAYRREASESACLRLMASPIFQESEWIYSYISIRSEVDTTCLIRSALASGKHVAAPVLDGDSMDFREINSLEECRPGAFSIPEPVADGQTSSGLQYAEQPGLMILPGLAFDLRGNRLGYGGGYYDRYLPLCMNAARIAVAFEVQKAEEIPADELDVPIDKIVTELGIYQAHTRRIQK